MTKIQSVCDRSETKKKAYQFKVGHSKTINNRWGMEEKVAWRNASPLHNVSPIEPWTHLEWFKRTTVIDIFNSVILPNGDFGKKLQIHNIL